MIKIFAIEIKKKNVKWSLTIF